MTGPALLTPASPTTTIEVNGKHFVSGLTWIALTKPLSYMDEARKIGKQLNMDMVAIRKRDAAMQAGFAPRTKQKLRGMYSLAAALGGVLGENWIGIFALSPDRYAFIAVHNGVVMAGRDLVADRATVESEFNDVYNLLSSESTESRWIDTGVIVAPEDWDFATRHSTLEELLNPKQLRNEHRLRPLRFGLTAREIIAMAACIAVLGGAAVGFLQWQKAKERRMADANAQQLADLQAQMAKQPAAVVIEKPWTKLPSVATFLEACRLHWQSVPLSLGGWYFTKGTCTPTGAAATYVRPDGGTTVAEFTEKSTGAGFPKPSMYDAGTSAVFVKVFQLAPFAGDELQANDQVLPALTSALQSAQTSDTDYKLTDAPWTPPAETPNAPAPDWTTTKFEVTSALTADALLGSVNHSGVRIREINASLNNDEASLTWTITGEIYAR